MPTPFVKAAKEMFWLGCLLWGILFLIVGTTEGVPYTSIHVRGEFLQVTVGMIGLVLAVVGMYLGFRIGKRRR